MTVSLSVWVGREELTVSANGIAPPFIW
jgi:hypothetical protein